MVFRCPGMRRSKPRQEELVVTVKFWIIGIVLSLAAMALRRSDG